MFRSSWHAGGLGALIGALSFALPSAPADDFDLLFQKLDPDGDGRFTRYEGAEAMLLLAEQADENEDGGVDVGELRRYLADDQEERQEEFEAFFEELDENTNGVLEPRELPAGFREGALEADVDGDRRLSYAEYVTLESYDFVPDEEQARFTIEVTPQGERAVMNGVIGASTPGRVLELILEHPQVRTIELRDVPGSMDDVANLRAARLIHRHGFATHVADRGVIASGGVDFFLAGARRSLGKNARLGVHSWGGTGESALDLPRDDPQHLLYLEFYEDVDVPTEFYWYTLEAANAQDIHWMSADEIELFDVVWPPSTEPREKPGEATGAEDTDPAVGNDSER